MLCVQLFWLDTGLSRIVETYKSCIFKILFLPPSVDREQRVSAEEFVLSGAP